MWIVQCDAEVLGSYETRDEAIEEMKRDYYEQENARGPIPDLVELPDGWQGYDGLYRVIES